MLLLQLIPPYWSGPAQDIQSPISTSRNIAVASLLDTDSEVNLITLDLINDVNITTFGQVMTPLTGLGPSMRYSVDKPVLPIEITADSIAWQGVIEQKINVFLLI